MGLGRRECGRSIQLLLVPSEVYSLENGGTVEGESNWIIKDAGHAVEFPPT